MLKTYICDICICVLEKEKMMIPWWKQNNILSNHKVHKLLFQSL